MDTDEMTVTGILPVVASLSADASPDAHAEAVGLVHTSDDEPGIKRVRRGRGFSYVRPDGTTVPRGEERDRLEALTIPPAWTDVWISTEPRGHLQATGADEAGRKQYRYHERWREVRDATKFHRMTAFADALPAIRATVDRHLRRRKLSRQKILALVVALLDETLIRVGSARYAEVNGAHGITTLRGDHVDVGSTTVRFSFPGKSGQDREVEFRHRRLARQMLRCEEIPGQRLFAYREDDVWSEVDSGAVNGYLGEAAGDVHVTAKDFRTWGATAIVTAALHEMGSPSSRRDAESNILAAIDEAAQRLGNSRAVARSSYVDPRVPKAYRFARLHDSWEEAQREGDERLRPAERAVRRILDLELPRSATLDEPRDQPG